MNSSETWVPSPDWCQCEHLATLHDAPGIEAQHVATIDALRDDVETTERAFRTVKAERDDLARRVARVTDLVEAAEKYGDDARVWPSDLRGALIAGWEGSADTEQDKDERAYVRSQFGPRPEVCPSCREVGICDADCDMAAQAGWPTEDGA